MQRLEVSGAVRPIYGSNIWVRRQTVNLVYIKVSRMESLHKLENVYSFKN